VVIGPAPQVPIGDGETMPPSLAALIWFVLLLLLFRYDPAKEPTVSRALWVPVIWLFIAGSRLPSQWFGIQQLDSQSAALEEGNGIDRTIWLLLIVLAIGILLSRAIPWAGFVARNCTLIAYLCFALVSVMWSDFAFISFKRWIRDLGSYLMILIVLSDPHPLEAVRTLLRRLAYLLIPLSIILIKYFPDIGIRYDEWTGLASSVGATVSKNMLGALCLVSGLFFLWDTLTRWSDRTEQRSRWIFVNFSFLFMTLYLLRLAHSATSTVCLGLGCLIIVAVRSKFGRRHSTALKVAIPSCFLLFIILGFGFGSISALAEALGRDPTLTGRTVIWRALLTFDINPLLGTGYSSFWLGPRLQKVWALTGSQGAMLKGIDEAHDGYLETYLNLGLVGLVLFCTFLSSSYRTICRKLDVDSGFSAFALAMWTVLIFYMVTESGFRGGLLPNVFLLGAVTMPLGAGDAVSDEAAEDARAFDLAAAPIGDQGTI